MARLKWEQGVRWAYTEKLVSKKSKKCSKQNSCPAGRQVAAWFMACSTWRQLTAQTGKILRVGVCQQSRKSLLPVIQLTAFHNISPVVCHHWGYKLQDRTNKTFSAWNAFSRECTKWGATFVTFLTIETLFFCLLRYFCCVFFRSSSPPLMDNRIASA